MARLDDGCLRGMEFGGVLVEILFRDTSPQVAERGQPENDLFLGSHDVELLSMGMFSAITVRLRDCLWYCGSLRPVSWGIYECCTCPGDFGESANRFTQNTVAFAAYHAIAPLSPGQAARTFYVDAGIYRQLGRVQQTSNSTFNGF
jgi:hypothetical protein